MEIKKVADKKWDKNDLEDYQVYMTYLTFPEIRYFESGKAKFTASIGFGKKLNEDDKKAHYVNARLEVWGEDGEALSDAIGDKNAKISIKGGNLSNGSFIKKNGETYSQITIKNPDLIVIYEENTKENTEEIPF